MEPVFWAPFLASLRAAGVTATGVAVIRRFEDWALGLHPDAAANDLRQRPRKMRASWLRFRPLLIAADAREKAIGDTAHPVQLRFGYTELQGGTMVPVMIGNAIVTLT
jgi:hypothetical protein